jgi:hypothetical protein
MNLHFLELLDRPRIQVSQNSVLNDVLLFDTGKHFFCVCTIPYRSPDRWVPLRKTPLQSRPRPLGPPLTGPCQFVQLFLRKCVSKRTSVIVRDSMRFKNKASAAHECKPGVDFETPSMQHGTRIVSDREAGFGKRSESLTTCDSTSQGLNCGGIQSGQDVLPPKNRLESTVVGLSSAVKFFSTNFL